MKKPAHERIADIRESKGLSCEDLGDKLKESRLWVWRIETGRTKLLAADLPRIARALGVDVEELVA